MNDRYRHKYELTWHHGDKQHMWIVETDLGAVHLHVTEYGERMLEFSEGMTHSGGVEYHWRTRPDWAEGTAPHFPRCPILNAPCWHDGTSMYAREHYVPMIQRGAEHEEIFASLERDADRTLAGDPA